MRRNNGDGETWSKCIEIARVLAIFSVITAHLSGNVNEPGIGGVVCRIQTWFGQIGVIVFLLIGGGLFHHRSVNDKTYWLKKGKKLIIPWLFCGTMTYVLSAIIEREFSVTSLGYWILGSGTWFYYMTIYGFCLVLFQFIRNQLALSLMVLLTLVSLLLTDMNIIPYTGGFTKYLNPFNWAGFFAMGIMSQKIEINSGLFRRLRLKALAICSVSIVIMSVRRSFSYFSIESAFFEVGASILLFDLSYALSQVKIGEKVALFGKNTFCIYLIHIQIVQMIGSRLPDTLITDISKPIVGLIIMLLITELLRKIAVHSAIVNKVIRLIGLS